MQPLRSTSAKTNKMAHSSRHSDYGEEFVERLRRDRFKKAYILVNGVSSEEEEDEELDFGEEDEEVTSFAMGTLQQPPRPSSTYSSRRPPSIAASYSQRAVQQAIHRGFDARDLYFFGVISELTDKFSPERAARLINRNSPPPEYRTLVSIERIAYLLYYSLYGKYLNVAKFHNIFNREFFKYTSAGDSERNAFLKICRHTLEEYKRRLIEQNKRAYKMTQKHLFSDERATPDSRTSDRPSICADESIDQESLESLPKELMFYRAPHTPVRFGPGGRIIYVNPDSGMSLVCIEDTKKFYKDLEGRRYVEMMESFKGPMLVGQAPPQTPLLFIQRQIDRILRSDVYRANPSSGDANDCLLIWHLLEMLVRQQGKVTGPDLARLLCSNQQYPSFTYKNFLKNNSRRGRPETIRQDSSESIPDDLEAMDRITRFLLGGHIEEAIESAISDGLLFDAFILAYRLYRNDPRRLAVIEARLMSHRSPQDPITTLVSVAADLPVPLLNNPTTEDSSGWRGHIAIVLANLQTQTAMNAVYHLALTLAKKEFNSAADFCFLAVNLLTGYNCFQQPISNEAEDQSKYRKHISLINASLPDDEITSCITRFGWSIVDYQATEIYDFALQMANPAYPTALSHSADYIRSKKQYVQLLDELGGFGYAIELYNNSGGESHVYPHTTPSPPNVQMTKKHFFSDEHATPESRMSDRPSICADEGPMAVGHTLSQNQLLFIQQQIDQSNNENQRDENIPNTSALPKYGDGGFLSKIKPQGENQMNLPDDRDPTIIWDSQLRKHVDQENKDNPPEELPPPPTSMFISQQPLRKESREERTSTPLNSQEIFPQMPANDENQGDANIPNTSALAKGGDGFIRGKLSGLLSKIKPQGQNQMKLPDDRNPKIIWDSQLGKYVDQENKDNPPEELPPPPTSMFISQQPQRKESREERTSTPLNAQEIFPQMPDIFTIPPIPKAGVSSSSRPFQGKARYANAWNS